MYVYIYIYIYIYTQGLHDAHRPGPGHRPDPHRLPEEGRRADLRGDLLKTNKTNKCITK